MVYTEGGHAWVRSSNWTLMRVWLIDEMESTLMRVRLLGLDAISAQNVKEPRVEELQSIAIGSWLRIMNFFVFGP